MELRTALESLQAMKGITSDEKGQPELLLFAYHTYVAIFDVFIDPEEFLNVLLKKIFVATPYLEIR